MSCRTRFFPLMVAGAMAISAPAMSVAQTHAHHDVTAPAEPETHAVDAIAVHDHALHGEVLSATAAHHGGTADGHAGEAVPPVTDADRAAAFPDLKRPMQHAPTIHRQVVIERLEVLDADAGTTRAWGGHAWLGNDLQRLWLRAEGEHLRGTTSADLDVLYGRSVTPWWDVLAGIRHEHRDTHSVNWAAFGVQGRMPGNVETKATILVRNAGRLAVMVELERDVLLTNRWILQPRFEARAHAGNGTHDVAGNGLESIDAGVRLRYEVSRRFAPYVGVAHTRVHGDSADRLLLSGGASRDTRWLAGLRLWF